jgi:integrase/recombinase XerD
MSRGWIKTDEKLISFALDNEEISNKGAYINLMKQLNRLAHNEHVRICHELR